MKNTIINSTLALSTAFLVTIFLHEIAHYLFARGLGYDAILYNNRVEGVIENTTHQLLVLGMGPLFSFIQGVVAYESSKKMKPSIVTLFTLWFGIAGLITFFGYMMISPIGAVGDTGKIFQILDVSLALKLIIAVCAVILLTLILIKSTVLFEQYVNMKYDSIRTTRRRWGYSLILIPLLISIVVITLLQFPIRHPISILATLCAPFAIMAVFGTFASSRGAIEIRTSDDAINKTTSSILIVAFVTMVVVNRLLTNGL